MFRKILLGLLFSFVLWKAVAGEHTHIFRHYQVKDGLSDNLVTAFVQDKRGFLWVGTRDGLNRFDGYTFKVYEYNASDNKYPDSNRVNRLLCDAEGDLWAGTNSGLYRYDEKKDAFELYPSTRNKKIDLFAFDADNQLWRLDNGILVRENTRDHTYKLYLAKDNLLYSFFCITPDDQGWVSDTGGSISRLDREDGSVMSWNLFGNTLSARSGNIYQLYPSRYTPEIIVAYESDNLKVFDTSTFTCRELDVRKAGQGSILINCLLEINEREIWIGTDIGILIYKRDRGEWTKIAPDLLDPHTISSHFVATLYKDRENGIWIGYHQNGLSYYSSFDRFEIYYPTSSACSFQGRVVHDIVSDASGTVWIATEDARISAFHPGIGEFTNYFSADPSDMLAHSNIRGLGVQSENLWIGHVIHGIDRMDIRRKKRVKNYPLYKDSAAYINSKVTTMKVMKDGQVLVATSDGIYAYEDSTDRFVLKSDRYAGILYEDNLQRLWIGNQYCDRTKEKEGKWEFMPMELPARTDAGEKYGGIVDMYCEENGDIWFLTGNGILKYTAENEHFKWIVTGKQMPTKVVFRILPDAKGNAWVSTAVGLVCVDGRDGSVTNYTEAHGLITPQFNYYAGWKDTDGFLYFGTVKGLVRFNPDKIVRTSKKVEVFITSVEFSGNKKNVRETNVDTLAKASVLDLPHDQSTFNISFSTLSYIAPGSTHYQYRLMGMNREWNTIGTRNIIYFTDLPPGQYTLEIKASDLSGRWDQSVPLRLHINIRPPWWASADAYGLYIVLFLGSVYGAIRFWLKEQKKSMTYEMQLFENRKEKELYRAKIDFFITIAHEIRTPLTLIKIPLERLIAGGKECPEGPSLLRLIQKNVSRLIELADQLLDFRKAETEGCDLSFVRVEITSFLTAAAYSFKESAEREGITFELDLPVEASFVYIDKEAMTKILSNLFSNALKYTRRHIRVVLSVAPDVSPDPSPTSSSTPVTARAFFTIDCINDGAPIPEECREKIFEPFYRLPSLATCPGTGLGLSLTRFLVEKHKGHIDVAESSEEKTVFRITMPVEPPGVLRSLPEKPVADAPAYPACPAEAHRISILIVEDNREMRALISAEISRYYNVLTAAHGKEALSLLAKNSVQLLISDVLMPVMDGFELLKKIKTNLEFSHIPVILLTAKNTMQARLEGLELGADAYIDKPFSMDILLAQISNLLVNRENIRQFYFKSPIANLKSMAYSKADEEFLEKLNALIEEHLSDPDFDVNTIAGLFCMSRPTLYRKINALSHLTPHELIKIARLKKAAELLLQGELKIYEISELVGFSSQSYFWSAFIKQFGMSPSKYAKANRSK